MSYLAWSETAKHWWIESCNVRFTLNSEHYTCSGWQCGTGVFPVDFSPRTFWPGYHYLNAEHLLTRTLGDRSPPLRRIRGPDPVSASGWLPEFNGNSLVHGYICDKIYIRMRSVFPRMWDELWKTSPSRQRWIILQKIPRSGIPDPFWRRMIPYCNPVYTYISGKVFMKIPSQQFWWEVVKRQTNIKDIQTVRWTNAGSLG